MQVNRPNQKSISEQSKLRLSVLGLKRLCCRTATMLPTYSDCCCHPSAYMQKTTRVRHCRPEKPWGSKEKVKQPYHGRMPEETVDDTLGRKPADDAWAEMSKWQMCLLTLVLAWDRPHRPSAVMPRNGKLATSLPPSSAIENAFDRTR